MSLLKRIGSRQPDEPTPPAGGPSPEEPGKRIALLLIEDNLAQAQLVRELLTEVPDTFFQIVHVDRLSAARQRLEKESFDVILSDLTLPDSDGLHTFEQVKARAPQTPIVIFSGLSDVSLATQAVQRGAQDYLIKGQVNEASLVRALNNAIERHRQAALPAAPRSRVLALVGAKGGSGTSTVALNLATLLAAQQPTILVELRPYLGTLAAQLQKTPADTLATLLSLDPKQLSERALRRCLLDAPGGVQLLPASPTLHEEGRLTPAHVEALVRGLRAMTEVVLLDLSLVNLPALAAALQQADLVIVVSEPEPVALKASQALLAGVARWGVREGASGVILVNRSGDTLATLNEFQASLRVPLLGVVPPAAEACLMATSQGIPLVLSQPEHRAVAAMTEISQKVLAAVEALPRP